MPYTIADHAHNYAAWCAATAARRGLPKGNGPLVSALEASDLPALLNGPPDLWPATDTDFAASHSDWCQQVMAIVDKALGADGACSFGRAAKLVAIYIKTRVVVGDLAANPFARVAHPPIDRILLQNLASDPQFPVHVRQLWRGTTWTTLSEAEYAVVIESLRMVVGEEPWWTIEQYWSPVQEN